MLVNMPLWKFAPRWAFSSGELAVALGMTLVSCTLPSSGLMRYLPGFLVGSQYLGIESAELRQILLGEKASWSPQLAVAVVMRAPKSHERDAALRICDMTEAQFRQHWIEQVFRGGVRGPKVAGTAALVVQDVTTTPGALALVDPAAAAKGVKILRIDGKLPADAGYAVR